MRKAESPDVVSTAAAKWQRLRVSLAGALAYAVVYWGAGWYYGLPVAWYEVVLGALAFFGVFWAVRSWLDRRRDTRDTKRNEYAQTHQEDLSP